MNNLKSHQYLPAFAIDVFLKRSKVFGPGPLLLWLKWDADFVGQASNQVSKTSS